MKTRTRIVTAAAAATVFGAVVAFAAPTLAHGPSGPGYSGHGYAMMGQGHGMMGQGDHHGRQGLRGMGHRGTKGDCSPGVKARDRDLSVDDVRKIVEGRLARRGNDRLKVGKVEAKDETTIIAEIVTIDDSLVKRIEFDRKTGARKRVK